MGKKVTADQPAPSAPQSTEDIEKERLEYLGGTTDEIDSEDLSAEDRGDIADPAEIEKAEAKRKEEEEAAEAAEKEQADADAAAEKEKEDAKNKDKEGSKDDATGEDDKGDDKTGDKEKDDKEDDAGDKAKDDDATPPKKDDKPEPRGIPKSRFDQVNERRRVAEEEIARRDKVDQAVEAAKTVEKYDFDKAEDEYTEFLLDGKKDDARAKRAEIRAAEKAEWKAEAIGESTLTVAEQQSAAEVNDLTDQAQALYPVYDGKHEDYSPEITAKTMAFYNGYKLTRPPGAQTDADAMVMAIADTVALYGLDEKYRADADEEGKDADEEGKKEVKLPPKAEIDKKLKDAEQQPAPVLKGGEGSNDRGAAVPDIGDMTDEEMDALPAATLSRMRGDDAG